MNNKTIRTTLSIFTFIFILGCNKQIFIESGTGLADWSAATHGSATEPNYDIVFTEDSVHRLDIVIASDDWSDMQSDLSTVLSGSGGQGNFSDQTPAYVPCNIKFNGLEWYNVGVRYKGNSSLESSSQRGISKLPFRLNFDEFEDDFPETTDQRFYGFKELSLGNNFEDLSLMREKSACDLFRDFGVPAVRTAFYEIYVDYGSGPIYFGVYTLTEIVFDTFLKTQFGSEDGNCYKPEDDGAQFYEPNFNVSDFEQKTGSTTDKSDVIAMCKALNADTRTSNAAQWRADLEAVFDVDGFLKYLAVNNTIQNWDTYGNMSHNYYLYHDPSDDLLKWIVWDNNEAFGAGKGQNGTLSFGMTEVGTEWPLINYLIADPTYEATYKNYINNFVTTSFEYNRMNTIYSNQSSLLYDAASRESTGYTFLSGINSLVSAVSTLKSHCSSRISAATNYAN